MKSKKKYVGLKTSSGKTTKNPFETSTYARLIQSPIAVSYETDSLAYVTEHRYIPDFKIVRNKDAGGEEGGHQLSTFYIETKGNGRSWTPQVRKKMLAVKNQWPELDIRFLFYSDGEFGTRRKDGSRQRQSEWATKNGFPFAIREVPDEWLT